MSVALTRSRFINALRCYASYALSLFGSVRIFHGPMFVSVEPANICQLRCPECPVGKGERRKVKGERTTPFMNMELFRRVLAEVRDTAWVMQFYFQGEPLLNKDLPQMIREAHEAGIYTIVSTNAQAMTPELADELVQAGLSRIIVSMDGLTEESYNAYRVGGSLEKAKAALRWLRESKIHTASADRKKNQKSNILIELQCLRLKTNEHEWKAFACEYKRLGADRLTFKTAQLYDYEHGHPLMPSQPCYRRYEQGKDGLWHRKRLGKTCLRAWSGVVITTNGDVLPCCYDKAHAHAYGNIKEYTLKELFRNEKAMAFRKAALCQTPQICQTCWK